MCVSPQGRVHHSVNASLRGYCTCILSSYVALKRCAGGATACLHLCCLFVDGVLPSGASLEWRKRESHWRRAGVLLYQSEATVCVLERLEVEIEAGRLGVRKDCCVESDLGLRQRLLDMLFCYNPVWLKLGLEVRKGVL